MFAAKMKLNVSPRFWALAVLLLMAVFVGGCSDDSDQIEVVPTAQGKRGESCRARNDCADGLACIHSTCVRNDYPISAVGGSCAVIECESTQDCCQLSPQCEDIQGQCSRGDSWACDAFEQQCACQRVCKDNLCQRDLSCNEDRDCGYGLSCENNRCVQCTSDDQCSGDRVCVEGVCDDGCKVDANCPLFHTCENSECVESGCSSDRECVLFTNNGSATCSEGECLVACESDAECNSGTGSAFQVCEKGRCVFVGCESDAECRAALDLKNRPDTARAVCEQSGN